MNQINEITGEEFLALFKKEPDISLIDVRTAEEREEYKIEGSIHIPLDELPLHINSFPKEKEIYFHCKSGKRSAIACTAFSQAGFQKIYNIKGGIIAMQEVKI